MITFVQRVRTLESALGDGVKKSMPSEENVRRVARRSLVLKHAVKTGDIIEASMLTAIRPGGGIDPYLMEFVVGHRAKRSIKAGHMLTWQDLR